MSTTTPTTLIDVDDDDEIDSQSSESESESSPSSRSSSPQTPTSASYRTRPSITISYPMQPSNASSSRLNLAFPPPPKLPHHSNSFIAPAHPQSHHLHVLPPRKKSTRALIIDHTIWRLVRTRFAQARCQLGMYVKLSSHAWHQDSDLDRNVGFHPLHLAHQHQHGNFGDPPEIDVASSDDQLQFDQDHVLPDFLYNLDPTRIQMQDVSMRHRRHDEEHNDDDHDHDNDNEDHDNDDEEEEDIRASQRRRIASHNKRHAPFLSARAEGMQKVLFAVLLQPTTDDSTINPPSPDSLNTIPNRLRLALMLLRIVDDLFGAPKSSPTLSTPSTLSAPSSAPAPPSTSSSLHPSFSTRPPAVDPLPAHLESLFQISNQSLSFPTKPTFNSFRTLSLPSPSNPPSSNPDSNVFVWDQSSEKPTTSGEPKLPSSNNTTRPRPALAASSSSSSSSLLDPPAAAKLLAWRPHYIHIPDHSHKTAVQNPSTVRSPKQASGRARELYFLGCTLDPLTTTVTPIGRLSSSVTPLFFGSSTKPTATQPTLSSSSSSSSSSANPGYPIEKLKTLCSRHLRQKCTTCARSTDARTRIGAGLLSSSGSWFLDRRRRSSKQTGSVLADLISDFMRLSAYIISELQEYLIGDLDDSESTDQGEEDEQDPDEQQQQQQQQQQHHHSHHHRRPDGNPNPIEGMSHKPTRAWYSLLCGLITRAVLEGYVSRGWKGSKYVEVLMGMGLGVEDASTLPQNAPDDSEKMIEDEEGEQVVVDDDDECLPEGTPTLIEACHILFDNFGKHLTSSHKEIRPPEREYISVMEARITEFLEIPHTCPDLATHLTGLSAKYPAEPVERAALQFCEAVSKWRGKPELEMYKAKHKSSSSSAQHDLWIRKYFQIPTPGQEEQPNSSTSTSVERGTKRQVSPHRETFPPVLKKGKMKDDSDHMDSGI